MILVKKIIFVNLKSAAPLRNIRLENFPLHKCILALMLLNKNSDVSFWCDYVSPITHAVCMISDSFS